MDFDTIKDKAEDFFYAIKSNPKKKKIAVAVVIVVVGLVIYFTK